MQFDKQWLRENVPHISKSIEDVKENEGVEITINCNITAFRQIMETLKDETDLEVTINTCINLLVSTNYLGL